MPITSMNSAKRPKLAAPLRVAIVGAGRVGTALGIALVTAGVEVVAAVCRRKPQARSASRMMGPTVIGLGAKELDKLPKFDLAVIATPDDLIAGTASALATAGKNERRSITVLHVSGSLPSTIMSTVALPNWSIGSLHPLLAISDPSIGAANLRTAYFCLEGQAPAVRVARRLVQTLGAQSVSIATKNKALYHASAVMAAGHMVSLFDLAARVLVRCGPTPEAAAKMLYALTQSAVQGLDQTTPASLMTGPFARGDVATIERHLRALSAPALAEARAAYLILGEHAIGLAQSNGVDASAVRRIRALLSAVQ